MLSYLNESSMFKHTVKQVRHVGVFVPQDILRKGSSSKLKRRCFTAFSMTGTTRRCITAFSMTGTTRRGCLTSLSMTGTAGKYIQVLKEITNDR
jgi:hypothetical protein